MHFDFIVDFGRLFTLPNLLYNSIQHTKNKMKMRIGNNINCCRTHTRSSGFTQNKE